MLKVFFIAFIMLSITAYYNFAFACFSITDDYNFPNPVLNANFNILPDVSPQTDCWKGAIRIRSDKRGWRLVASRTGPNKVSGEGDHADDIMAGDLTIDYSLMAFGMADPDGAILVPPFSSETNLSSIKAGTLIVSGIKRTGGCSIHNPNFYKLNKNLCLFKDFVFNIGEYTGQIYYILVAP